MASEKQDDMVSPLKASSSSWPIFRASLDAVVTCESSISAALDDSLPDHSATPLILRRPSPHSAPCEITLLFTQLHKIKQIYVRSTARVYEIYYATNEKGGNEYLCTVRCGIAARDEELQLENDGAGSFSTGSTGSNVNVDEGHSTTESGSSTNEDGWVDVKFNDSSRVGSGDISLSSKKGSDMVQGSQDLFEATAEISDADPVLSITLRLLSIQSGDYTFVDEVYVFADPVESSDDQTPNALESSSGSALLSMFIPTLMQLSKSRANKAQERGGSDAGESSTVCNNERHSTAAAVTSTNTSKAEIMSTTISNGALLPKCQSEHPVQTPNLQNGLHFTDGEKDFPHSKIEQTLDILVSRVSKIEDFCSRFEEKMLKPIVMMQTRLQRVEQQLESLIKHPEFPKTGCTRYSAPEFSCNESKSNSEGSICLTAMMKSESTEKDDGGYEEFCVPASDVHSCANAQCHVVQSSTSDSHVLPGLVVTAPDFSFSDDEEGNESTEAVKDSSEDTLKRPMSIDDALASALAGLVSSASIKPVQCSEIMEQEYSTSPTSLSALSTSSTRPLECSELVDVGENFSGSEGRGNVVLSASIQSDEYGLPSALGRAGETSSMEVLIPEKESFAAVNDGEETTEADDVNGHVLSEGGSMKSPAGSDSISVEGLGEMKNSYVDAEIGSTEENDNPSEAFLSNFNYSSTFSDNDPPRDVFAGAVEVPEGNVESSSGEGGASKFSVLLHGIVELASPVVVDFSAPLLDVKFSTLDSASAKPSLEALLVDVPDFGSKDPCVGDDNASSCNESYDLLRIEDDSTGVSETLKNELFFLEYCKSVDMPSVTEEQDWPHYSHQDVCASLI